LRTVATEAMLLLCIIDAEEGRDVAVIDIPNAFIQMQVEEKGDMAVIKICGVLMDIYQPYVMTDKKRTKIVRAFSTIVVTSGFSGVLVVLFQSHFLSSVLAKFLAKTCYKFMTFWQNRAKFTTALSWVLAIFVSMRKQICSPLLLFQRVGGSSKSHICLWHSLSSLSFMI
jgi:hypothetical protein